MVFKINMFISNNNRPPVPFPKQINPNGLTQPSTPKASTALNGPLIGRIHSIKPGCGSCGRH